MGTLLQANTEASNRLSLMEHLTQWTQRLRVPPLFMSVLLAMIMSICAGLIGIRLAREYLSFTPYYYDSSAYRVAAVDVYRTHQTDGLMAALKQSLSLKDGLDVTLRLLLSPNMLAHRFGHMIVLVPFMSIFVFLTIWFVFSCTHSMVMGILATTFLFTSGLIYGPYAGIADYWKDSLGTWILGSACITWLLSERLVRRGWSVLCGLFLGLLLMQRTGAAVYAAPLFGVLFLWEVYKSIRLDGLRQTIIRIFFFVTPAALLTGLVATFQFQSLYKYYFGVGYAYGSMQFIASGMMQSMVAYGGVFLYLVAAVCILCVFSISVWDSQVDDIITTVWFAAGFPALIILSRSSYLPGFYACWVVLLIVLLAALLPRNLTSEYRRIFLVILFIVGIGGSAVQYTRSSLQANRPDPEIQATRNFYVQVANVLLDQPEPRVYKLIFTEVGADFWNLMYFDLSPEKALAAQESSAFFSVHDSYYRAAFGNMTAEQITQLNVERLEQIPGTIVVADCEPRDILKRTWFAPNPAVDYLANGNPFAADVAVRMSEHVLQSPHWKALSRLNSPFGCMYVYQYAQQPLSVVEKWRHVDFASRLIELPLTLSTGPSVRMYNYVSQYQPEEFNGVYYQWLPSGAEGLRLTLFSDQSRTIILQAHVIPGPARKDANRTLVATNAQTEASAHVDGEQDIQLKLELHAGLNQIELSVKEPADTPPKNGGDPRELMLLLSSPHLVLNDK